MAICTNRTKQKQAALRSMRLAINDLCARAGTTADGIAEFSSIVNEAISLSEHEARRDGFNHAVSIFREATV